MANQETEWKSLILSFMKAVHHSWILVAIFAVLCTLVLTSYHRAMIALEDEKAAREASEAVERDERRAMEARLLEQIASEGVRTQGSVFAVQQTNNSKWEMTWAHMVKLTSTIERAGFEAPPMPEE